MAGLDDDAGARAGPGAGALAALSGGAVGGATGGGGLFSGLDALSHLVSPSLWSVPSAPAAASSVASGGSLGGLDVTSQFALLYSPALLQLSRAPPPSVPACNAQQAPNHASPSSASGGDSRSSSSSSKPMDLLAALSSLMQGGAKASGDVIFAQPAAASVLASGSASGSAPASASGSAPVLASSSASASVTALAPASPPAHSALLPGLCGGESESEACELVSERRAHALSAGSTSSCESGEGVGVAPTNGRLAQRLVRNRTTARMRRERKKSEAESLTKVVTSLRLRLKEFEACLEAMEGESKLAARMVLAEFGEPPLACLFCPLSFSEERSLDEHTRMNHARELKAREQFFVESRSFGMSIAPTDANGTAPPVTISEEENARLSRMSSEERKKRRLERNAASARLCRQRKKLYVESLRAQLPPLRHKVAALEAALPPAVVESIRRTYPLPVQSDEADGEGGDEDDDGDDGDESPKISPQPGGNKRSASDAAAGWPSSRSSSKRSKALHALEQRVGSPGSDKTMASGSGSSSGSGYGTGKLRSGSGDSTDVPMLHLPPSQGGAGSGSAGGAGAGGDDTVSSILKQYQSQFDVARGALGSPVMASSDAIPPRCGWSKTAEQKAAGVKAEPMQAQPQQPALDKARPKLCLNAVALVDELKRAVQHPPSPSHLIEELKKQLHQSVTTPLANHIASFNSSLGLASMLTSVGGISSGGGGSSTTMPVDSAATPTGGSALLSFLPYEWSSLLTGLRKTDSSSAVGSDRVHTQQTMQQPQQQQQHRPLHGIKAEQLPSTSLGPSEHHEDIMKAAIALTTFSPLALGASASAQRLNNS